MRRHNSAKVLILLPDPCFTTKNCRMSINLRFGGHTLPHIPLVSTEKHPNGRGFRSVGSILWSFLTRLCPFPSTRGLRTRFLPKSAKSFESQPFIGIQVDCRTFLADPLHSPFSSSDFGVSGSPGRGPLDNTGKVGRPVGLKSGGCKAIPKTALGVGQGPLIKADEAIGCPSFTLVT